MNEHTPESPGQNSAPSGITILVCGGRDWNYPEMTFRKLDALHRKYNFGVVVHGAARGADQLAGKWAAARGIQTKAFPANWRPAELGGRLDRQAGFKRNQKMLEEAKPDLLVAFPGGAGTADMRNRARKAGMKVVNLANIVASWREHFGLAPC